MAALTHNQKETIRKLKLKISDTTFTIVKIQDLSPIEQNLLKQALNYVVVDKVGDYEDGRVRTKFWTTIGLRKEPFYVFKRTKEYCTTDISSNRVCN